jgi:putative ABC transport system ATP-binding protein
VIELMFDAASRKGTTLLLITHDRGLAERCDRIVRLMDGQIVDDRRMTPRIVPVQAAGGA